MMNNPEDKIIHKFISLMENKNIDWIYSKHKWIDTFLKESPFDFFRYVEIIGCHHSDKKFLKLFPIYNDYCVVKFELELGLIDSSEYGIYINSNFIRICDSPLYEDFIKQVEFIKCEALIKSNNKRINKILQGI